MRGNMMKRREFLASVGAAGLIAGIPSRPVEGVEPESAGHHHACHPTYENVSDAMAAPPERFAFVPAILVGTKSNTDKKHPDYLATVDVDRESKTYGQIVGRFSMPTPGDELHHYGWNACSSCHGERHRRYLVVPGLASGNIYMIDALDPANLKLHKTISGQEIAKQTNLSTPHTVHCRADGVIMISMLGDAEGNAPGGFLEIDPDFKIAGHWEASTEGMNYNYDFWYQPRHNVMVSSEWAAPNTVKQGFNSKTCRRGNMVTICISGIGKNAVSSNRLIWEKPG